MGSKAVAAQAVRSKTIFKLFDAVLTFPAIVIEGKDRTAAAWQVGDQETQVATGSGVFGLVAEAPPMRPRVSAIAKAGKGALRLAGSTIPSSQTTLQGLRSRLQPGVVAYPNGVLQARAWAWRNQRRRVTGFGREEIHTGVAGRYATARG